MYGFTPLSTFPPCQRKSAPSRVRKKPTPVSVSPEGLGVVDKNRTFNVTRLRNVTI